MDLTALKAGRSVMRRNVTKNITQVENLMNADPVDTFTLRIHYEMLQDLSGKLQNLDEQILIKLVSTPPATTSGTGGDPAVDESIPTAVDAEFEKAQEYQVKIRIAVAKADDKLQGTAPSVTSFSTAQGGLFTGRSQKQYQLPKIKLKKFSGLLSDWLSWWSHFAKIHEDPEIPNVDKFEYLSQSMTGDTRAKQLVDSYPMTEDNYEAAVNALRDRYGQEDLLVPHYIRELLKLVVLNATQKDKVPLSTLYDRIETDIRALGSLKVTTKEMGRFLHPIVESCLSEEAYTAWQRSALYEKDVNADPTKSKLDYLLQFLSDEAKREMKREARDFCLDMPEKEAKLKSKRKKVNDEILEQATVAGLSAQSVQGKVPCAFCNKTNHGSGACFRAKKLTYEERKTKAMASRLCYGCLQPGHRSSNCSSKITCGTCGGPHVDLMCRSSMSGTAQESGNVVTRKLEGLNLETVNSNLGVTYKSDVLLKTARVRIRNPMNGKEVVVRVLFDDGSQKSYVTGKVIKALSSHSVAKEESRIILMDGSLTDYEITSHHELVISSLGRENDMKMYLRERTAIGGPTSRIPVGPWIDELKKNNVTLSDLETEPGPATVDLLIGEDYYEQCRKARKIALTNGLFAVETIFGWTLSGPLPKRDCNVFSSNFSTEISKLWDLDAIGINDSAEHETKTEYEQRVKLEFQSSIIKKEDGRYQVKLPWKNGPPEIPSNYVMAKNRLISATNKMHSDQYVLYHEVFKSWLQEGIIEVVPPDETRSGFYLPHRPVIKMESQTTPIRPVFDASSRVGRNPSINMLLETGMNMLELIPVLLLRFRRYPIGATADIRKAFQTIEVHPEDRKYQKFLWWVNGPGSDIEEFQHLRVVFGMTCSPFILAAVLDYHLSNGSAQDIMLRDSLYVDNVAASFKTADEYRIFKKETTSSLAKAQMVLREWESNADESMENIQTSVLGVSWNKLEDTLNVKLPKSYTFDVKEVTSRQVLSLASQIFDPIGIVSPATLLPRLLLQESWRRKMKWDQPWGEDESQLFRKWASEIKIITEMKIPRHVFGEQAEDIQIHIFNDSCMSSYATVVFVRISTQAGVKIHLLTAKSRVAPLEKENGRKITIPRLELLACTIGARIGSKIQEVLKLKDNQIYYWSDSSTCIAWILRDEVWKVFVENRVREILRLTKGEQWRHIPGCANPADLPSRGCGFRELQRSAWWEGPVWLRLPQAEWPRSVCVYEEDTIISEKRNSTAANVVLAVTEPRFSHFLKNVRLNGWIRRFVENCQKKKENRNLSVHLNISEMRRGEMDSIRDIQHIHFTKNPSVKGFQVEKDDKGLWRLKTRLTLLHDQKEFKYPLILPKDDPLVHQLIRYVHETSYHSGTQFVLSKLRERYWVIGGRMTVKSIVNKCLPCQRYRVKSVQSAPAPLPRERLEATAAFQTTGVDLAGPIFLKGGKKAWICLYTCAVYRGVHLDLIDSLSTESFLLSLERFVNLFGRPSTLYSDNGTNFVGAQNIVKRLNWEEITRSEGVKKMRWNFIPPSAPWWGGWWERLVRTMKDLLRKMLGKAKLTTEEMRTCLSGVERVINERPLTSVTEDAADLKPLSPSMFMRDLPLVFPEGQYIDAKMMTEGYQKMQEIKVGLQARFRKEYLGFLTSRNLGQGGHVPEVNTLVMVGDTNKKRYQWPLGRIVELIKGKDDKIRVAKVRTAAGILVRPLQKLYPLETYEFHYQSKPEEEIEDKLEIPVATSEKHVDDKTRSGRVSRKPQRYGTWNHH